MKRSMKKILATVLCAVLFLTVFPATASAAETQGTHGDNLTWNYDKATNTLTISGEGPMVEMMQYPWHSCFPSTVIVEEGVTTIAPHSLRISSLQTVQLPSTLKSIGNLAFYHCSYMSQINFPEGLETIGENAFSYCKGLTELRFPSTLISIGRQAFTECSRVKTVIFTGSDVMIGEFNFARCSALEQVILPTDLKTLNSATFDGCTSLRSIELPQGLEIISSNVFNTCTALQEISIPNSVTKIGSYAFEDCLSLVSITVGENVTDWGTNVFYNCPNLEHLVFVGKKDNAPNSHTTRLSPDVAHYDATGSEAHWIEENGSRSFYCDLCRTVLLKGDTAVELPFSDVKSNTFYYKPVLWAIMNNITTGTSETTFSPVDNCTRGQIVTFLWRAYGCPEPESTTHNFTDIAENAYYYKAVLWAVEEGITTGMSATTFAPEKGCTRAQAVTFLWRAQGNPSPVTTANPFNDIAQSDYFYTPVLWAAENGITTGTTATTFSPNKTCDRSQIVTFLYRAMVEK